MISYLFGKIMFKGNNFIILNVNNIGYKIFLSANVLKKTELNQEQEFFIFQHIGENINDLFGFSCYSELDFFEKIISVSGVGPKKAISILSTGPIDQVRSAIANKKLDFLTSVPGIGKKMAEKICFGLKDKLGVCIDDFDFCENKDLADSLVSLGYKRDELGEALKKVDAKLALQEQIREALKYLGR
ncbi:MAG: Holliday junction branch migration protein RuvA [Patescibacteria group bacterium]|nr:Holliday junction branch migration protein RuvA [Patescibacteria group bacterium]